MRSRGWCFTINNDTYDDLDSILALDCNYLVFGFEEGAQGTPHIQGYVYFSNQRTLQSLSQKLKRAHLSIARGSASQNRDYCSKEGDFYEFGSIPSQGFRTDLSDLIKMINNNEDTSNIIDQFPGQYVRYHSGIEKMILCKKNQWNRDNKEENIEVIYLNNKDYWKNTHDSSHFIASCENDLKAYNNEKELVIYNQKKFDTHKLELLTKGIPYLITVGYLTKYIRPLIVYIID